MMLITLCFRSGYLSCPLPPRALEQGWEQAVAAPLWSSLPAPRCSWLDWTSLLWCQHRPSTRARGHSWDAGAVGAGSRRGQAPSRWGNRTGQLESKSQEKGGSPWIRAHILQRPFRFWLLLPCCPAWDWERRNWGTDCMWPGSNTSCCRVWRELISYGKKKREQQRSETSALHTASSPPVPGLLHCPWPLSRFSFSCQHITCVHRRAADPELLKDMKFFSFVRKMLCTQTSTGRTSTFNWKS